MNSLRNNWSEAKVVKSINSSMLNFTLMRIEGPPVGFLRSGRAPAFEEVRNKCSFFDENQTTRDG
ncbi:MAG TPA: hypothetical protein VKX49_10560 [Bryobacteraceae bacterium]|nr:hypothetical protein [Bryobacteraceae bacterium]